MPTVATTLVWTANISNAKLSLALFRFMCWYHANVTWKMSVSLFSSYFPTYSNNDKEINIFHSYAWYDVVNCRNYYIYQYRNVMQS